MRSIALFLTGNLFLVLITILHLIGYFLGSHDSTSESETQLLYLMQNLEVNMMGIMRTYMDLLNGYSLVFATSTLFFAIYNMAFVKYLRSHRILYRNILLINIFLWAIEFTIFVYYMVWPPIVLSGLGLIVFLMAYYFSFNMKLAGDE